MILRDHRLALVVSLIALSPFAAAGESASSIATTASVSNPHSLNLDLDYHAKRRARPNGNVEKSDFLLATPGLRPVKWPRRSDDLRAQLVTPELRRTPLVGWIATNLYRSKNENGWCVEADPGEGEYIVFYRLHL
jgi:hypothetical protein